MNKKKEMLPLSLLRRSKYDDSFKSTVDQHRDLNIRVEEHEQST